LSYTNYITALEDPTWRNGQKGCPVGKCSEEDYPLHWQQGMIEALEGRIAGLEPDILVFNSGLWEPLPGKVNITQFAIAGQRAVKKKQGISIFKTTTTTQSGRRDVDDKVLSRILEYYGWKIFDATSLTMLLPHMEKNYKDHFYCDDVHFLPQGNPEFSRMNSILLFSTYHTSSF
jgi:hypothetical protein